ncbi:hypothetical protein GMORB2_0007 [Geosmithia morbida]|uniref:Uncharacterized protein n=1 Tax=Geosmithia morbida TaxID=1094350 RepID=A0A9P5D754_9HYPO|nr:uncharacterized protein GMORB2_0007 [Geosmithia morbida]KAF4126271.1 hypothetical protein GMORB2_0007 [Geosmithia morbida]
MNASSSNQTNGLSGLSTTSASSSSLASQNQQHFYHATAPARTTAAQSSSLDSHLKDFTLVAEAAKRAQMAVMIRDFEDCGL